MQDGEDLVSSRGGVLLAVCMNLQEGRAWGAAVAGTGRGQSLSRQQGHLGIPDWGAYLLGCRGRCRWDMTRKVGDGESVLMSLQGSLFPSLACYRSEPVLQMMIIDYASKIDCNHCHPAQKTHLDSTSPGTGSPETPPTAGPAGTPGR